MLQPDELARLRVQHLAIPGEIMLGHQPREIDRQRLLVAEHFLRVDRDRP
jgi:hypothetical protein